MTKTAVVILNWNGQQYLRKFLPSVITHSRNAEIWVIDNGSTDDSVKLIEEEFPTVSLLKLPKNLGFTGGYNEGLKQIPADYYVLLNSDIEVSENWLSRPIEILENNPKAAACQPKILSYNDKRNFEYAGAAGGFIDILGYPFCRGRLFHIVEEDKKQYDTEREIFWASGACFFVKADIYHAFGGLNSLFFAHMEEIELCWRMKNAGYSIHYTPESVVYHVGGGTLSNDNSFKSYLNFRNGLAMLYINLPSSRLFWIIFPRLILDGVAGLSYLLHGKPKNLIAIIRAHFHFYGMIGKLKTIRKEVQESRVSPNMIGLYNKLLIFDFSILRKRRFDKLKIPN